MSTTVLSTISRPAESPAPATAPAAAPSTTEVPAKAAPEAPVAGTEVSQEAPVAVPSEPAKPEVDPDLQLAKKFDAVAKREARTRRQEAELQSRLTSIAEKEKALEAKLAEMEAALEDPVSFYLSKGKDPVEVAKRFAKPVTEEEKRIAKLEERLAKEEQEREERRQEQERQEAEARKHGLMRQFVGEIKPEEYPHLTAMYEPRQIPGLVNDLLYSPQDPTDPDSPTLLEAFKARHDRVPTNKEIRDALEHNAEVRAMSLIERLPKRPSASQATPTTPPANEESTSLSNQHASSSSSTITRNKSREEVMKEIRAELEAEAMANQ